MGTSIELLLTIGFTSYLIGLPIPLILSFLVQGEERIWLTLAPSSAKLSIYKSITRSTNCLIILHVVLVGLTVLASTGTVVSAIMQAELESGDNSNLPRIITIGLGLIILGSLELYRGTQVIDEKPDPLLMPFTKSD